MGEELNIALDNFKNVYQNSNMYKELDELNHSLNNDLEFSKLIKKAQVLIKEYEIKEDKDERYELLVNLSKVKKEINEDLRVLRIKEIEKELNYIFKDLNYLISNRPDKEIMDY